MKVLNIDDSTINNMLMENLLNAHGYQTFSIIQGGKAEETIEEYQPDIIILDLMMPDRSGFEIIEDLRRKNITIPIMVISAMKSEKIQSKLGKLGITEYHSKPIKINDLVESIQKLSKTNLGVQNRTI